MPQEPGSMSSMWDWAGFSDLMRRFALRRWAPFALLAAVQASALCHAKVYLTQEEALGLAFPPADQVERKTLFLDETQAAAVERESGSKLTGRVFSYYVGRGPKGIEGYAYFDTHRVRTLPETVMVLLDGQGAIRRVEILSFSEPEDYLPKRPWLDQFAGHRLDEELALRRGIHNLAGASLSADSITQACRRILALHRLASPLR